MRRSRAGLPVRVRRAVRVQGALLLAAALVLGAGPGNDRPVGASGARPSISSAGDLNGDGIADLTAWNPLTGHSMVVSGADGQRLDVPGAGGLVAWRAAGADIGGGPGQDVLRIAMVDVVRDRTCDQFGDCTSNETWTWEVSSHDRVGSAPQWTHRVPATLATEDNVEATDSALEERRSWVGDRDRLEVRVLGDAPATVLVTTLSTTGNAQSGTGPGFARLLGSMKSSDDESIHDAAVASLDGSGRVIGSMDIMATHGREEYESIGDVTGDGVPDVVISQYVGEFSERVVGLHDRTLRRHWGIDAHEVTRILAAPAGRNGRGRVAIVGPGIVDMRDAATGSRIWRSEYQVAAGTVRGEPISAIAYEAYESGGQPESASRNLSLRVGSLDLEDGQFLGFVDEHPLGEFEGSDTVTSLAAFEINGDGVLDLVGQEYVSGISGGRLFSITSDGAVITGPDTDYAAPVEGMDLDGIPGQEVLWKSYSEVCSCWSGIFAMRPGQRMWQVSRERFDRLVRVVSHDGVDFAEATVDQEGHPVVRMLDGSNFDVRWSVPLD